MSSSFSDLLWLQCCDNIKKYIALMSFEDVHVLEKHVLLTHWGKLFIISSVIQIMACHLTGAKPLSEPMLEYSELHTLEQTSVKC